MSTSIYGFPEFEWSMEGWNAILNTFAQMVDAYLFTFVPVTLGESIDKYDYLCIHSDGKAYRTTGLNGKVGIGCARSAGELDDEINVQRVGVITRSSWTWTPGSSIWVSNETSGGLTQIRPATGCGEQFVGIAISATQILLMNTVDMNALISSSSSSSSSISSSSSSSSSRSSSSSSSSSSSWSSSSSSSSSNSSSSSSSLSSSSSSA